MRNPETLRHFLRCLSISFRIQTTPFNIRISCMNSKHIRQILLIGNTHIHKRHQFSHHSTGLLPAPQFFPVIQITAYRNLLFLCRLTGFPAYPRQTAAKGRRDSCEMKPVCAFQYPFPVKIPGLRQRNRGSGSVVDYFRRPLGSPFFYKINAQTVGAEMSTSHIRPSAPGAVVTADAELVAVEERKLTFRVAAFDGDRMIGQGTHVRYVVDRDRFLSKL